MKLKVEKKLTAGSGPVPEPLRMLLQEEPVIEDSIGESDEELFLASLARPWLFEKLLSRYQAAFLRRAKRILLNEADAEDAVQETFVKLYRHADKFTSRGENSFRGWAYTVLINTSLSLYEKRKRAGEVELSEELEAVLKDPKTDAWRLQAEDADFIESVLSRMPSHFSAALRRFFLEGKSQEEMATEEGVKVGVIKTRVHRAKALFRKLHSGMFA